VTATLTEHRTVAARVRGSVLGVRDFRRLWSAQAVSTLGDQVFPIAATVSVLNAGGGAAQIGMVLGARWLAIVAFALVGGVWADRLPRRAVMMGADVFRFVAVAALVVAPAPPVWVLAALVFAVGAGEAFFRPAETALLPSILTADRLPAANGLISISYRSMAVLGPGVGGLLVAGLGNVRAAFAVNALTFAVSAVLLLGVREPSRTVAAPRASFVGELREGIDEVRRHAWIVATLLGATVILMGVIAPENVLLPVIGRREFGTDAVYATSLAAFSLGGVIGALVAMRVRPRHPGRVAWLSGLVWITVPLALMFPVAPWVLYAAYAVSGAAWEPFAVYWQSALQREVPQERLARVSSVDWMASFALMPLGLALTGPLVDAVGETPVLIGAAVVLVAVTAAVLRVPGVADFRNPPPPVR
jgi:MFS family permease